VTEKRTGGVLRRVCSPPQNKETPLQKTPQGDREENGWSLKEGLFTSSIKRPFASLRVTEERVIERFVVSLVRQFEILTGNDSMVKYQYGKNR
jgi:hypothetical protein